MKKIIGIIEIASNALRLKIGEKAQKSVKVIESVSYPLALGRDTFHNGKISFESLDKTADIIKGFLNIANEYGADEVHAFATTAIREAKNKDYILDQLKLKTGLKLNVIDEGQEKLFISKIVFENLDDDKKESSILIHLGSGNISIFVVQKGEITGTLNIKLGALRISELFDESIENSSDYVQIIKEYIQPFNDTISSFIKNKAANFIISGNETTTISKMCNAKIKGKNHIISRSSFQELYSAIKNSTPAAFAEEFNISPENAETLLPTIIIISRLLKFSDTKNIVSSMYTLGDALLYSYLYPQEEKKLSKAYAEFSVKAALEFAKKFECDMEHIERVRTSAVKIFDRMKKIHGMGEREKLMLNLAAILQDTGKFVTIKGHNRLSYHIVKEMDIIGINELERNIIAAAILFHNSIIPGNEYDEYSSLDTQTKVTVSKICAILKIANAVHSSHNPKFNEITIRLSGKELIITLSTYKNINLEKWNFKAKSKLFEDVYGIKAKLTKRSVM